MEYGLIGEKLGHSYSKIIHEKLADYKYDLNPLTKEEFQIFMERRDFKAINVTIPYKEKVIPYLDEMDDNAKQIGAVNTIVNINGKLIGHNTDFSGFLYMLQNNKVDIRDKKVLVLGNGGASKAVVAVLKSLKAKEILLVSRTKRVSAITYEECYVSHSDGQVIVNATPVGMYPNIDESPIDISKFAQCEAVLDLIYNPLKTKLLLQAENQGMKAVNGLEMLVAQAKYAVEFFLGLNIKEDRIKEVTNDVYAEILK